MKKTGIGQIKCLITLLVAVLFCETVSWAQTREVTVKLDMTDVPMKSVMTEIEKQTGFLFLYTNDIDTARPVSIRLDSRPLDEALALLFRNTDIAYKITLPNIVLSKRPASSRPTTVSGVVKDAEGVAVIGATVLVRGTTVGTTTGLDGSFTLSLPSSVPQPELQVSFIGYQSVTLSVGTRSIFDIELKSESVEVESVVVTALGIKRSEKALSYNVQQVTSESITSNKDANFINSLNGKVAGVTINASSSGVGGATKVVMRGAKSISQSSNALYVIDGVPMFTKARDGGTEFSSQGTTDPIADINPEDIESISVLTGAAAAALYGSDAANGAIVVTTKKGQSGQLTVTATSGVELMSPFELPRFQNRYGTGNLTTPINVDSYSWGKRLNRANRQGYEPRRDYFRTGVANTESVSLSTGTEKNQSYLSAGAINSQGIVPNNTYDRYNFTFRNTTSFFDDRMRLDVGANYVLQKDLNMINQGTYNNPLTGAYLFARSGDWEDIKMYERYDPVDKISKQYWPMGDGSITMQNPYWANYRNLRGNRKDRYMLNASLSYDVLDWLNVSGRIRLDNSHNTYTEKMYASSNVQLTEQSSNGLYGVTKTMDRQVYGDALVNISKTFGDDWSLQANIGGSFSDMKNDAMKIRGPISDGTSGEKQGLANVFNIQNLSNSTKTTRLEEGWREQTQSVFASAEVGYKGTYYLTLTGRNDWPSQLAGPHSNAKSFFYPSVGLSVVLSQIIPDMPENLSYIKLRGSFASVGVAFERYIANPLYSWNESGLSWNTQTQYPAFHLKPERTKSVELGLTMRFLRHFNLDVTYYNSHTSNQTFDPQLSGGTGFSSIIIQSGNVRNRGVELALGYKNTWRDFTWASNFTFSTNSNKILSLANNVINYATGERFSVERLNMGGLGDAQFLLQEGGTLGDLYSRRDLRYDENNAIYIDENGAVSTETIQDVNKYIKLGSVLPDANLSWRNDFRWKNLTFGFMVTARVGGIVYSRTQAMLDQYGVSEATAAARDAGGVWINGGDRVDAYTWYSAIAGGNSIPQFYTYSATNVRLQEASIGYTIPKKRLRNVCDITLSLVGRNLWMIYNKAPFDPESIATTGNYYQGIDYFMMPSLRSVGFNLRLKF
ncbi:MAG TPA: SusC/RagA family TonB-linked outer membrane protein [Candidatus Alistipes cottocaccae]|nr:SusC/RagA family TonB-linked outer membrane protein [Candidatus Alistipes cottocaccae]